MTYFKIIITLLSLHNALAAIYRPKDLHETLVQDLLKPDRHDRRVRPVENPAQVVNVTIGLSLQMIENLDERKQVLTSRVELYQSWYDYQLKWNPANYSGIKVVSISPKLIWIPDIFLYGNNVLKSFSTCYSLGRMKKSFPSINNSIRGSHSPKSADGRFGSGRKKINAVINHDGIVQLDYPTVFKTSCDLQIEKYPFDSQKCKMTLGSWAYTDRMLRLFLKEKEVNLAHYIKNGEWELKSTSIALSDYVGTTVSWDSVTITLDLTRLALYHSMYYLIPCAMIGFMTIIVFILPVNMNERMTVGLTLLIALSFFFLLMAENLPAIAETIPIAAKYYTATTVLSAFAYFMTCIVLKCHFSNPLEGDAPNWIRVLVLDWIATIIFMKESKEDDDENEFVFSEEDQQQNEKKDFKKMRELTKEERRSNSVIKNHVRLQATLDGRKEEWNKIAHVLNRLFMLLYTSTFLLLTVLLLASAVWMN